MNNDMGQISSCVAALVAMTLWLSGCAGGPVLNAPESQTVAPAADAVHVRLLAMNDFHGHLDGPSGTVMVAGERVPAGGVANLAAHIEALRAAHPATLVVAAGDLVGASPLISSLFHDEPTVEALTMAGLDVSSVGNHEFDRGVDELLRLQHGGCHPERGCTPGRRFDGAGFTYLAANVRYRANGETILPAVDVREVGGVRIAFVGLTLEATPTIVAPGGVEAVSFDDEIETINALVPTLRQQGIETIVVLIHEGGHPAHALQDVHGCPEISGPIVDIVRGVDLAVDVFVTGHTHQLYICEIDGRLVTSADSYGRVLTMIDLYVEPRSGAVVARKAQQLVVDQTLEPVEQVARLVAEYRAASAELADRAVGRIAVDLPRQPDHAGESVLGKVIADAQLAATASDDGSGAAIAFINPGGIRESLLVAAAGARERGVVTYAQLHTVQPFANMLVTLSLTGAQIHRLLEQQWSGQPHPRVLNVSAGFAYQWDSMRPDGHKVDAASIMLHGHSLDADRVYRVTVPDYLANGGDLFSVLTEGAQRVVGPQDLDALVGYFQINSPVAAPADARIRRVR